MGRRFLLLINRQKAEIERLTEGCKTQAKYIDHLEQTEKFVENEKAKAKSEARKEFVERLKEKVENARRKYQRLCKEQGEKEDEIMNIHFNGMSVLIDNLLEEMEGNDG